MTGYKWKSQEFTIFLVTGSGLACHAMSQRKMPSKPQSMYDVSSQLIYTPALNPPTNRLLTGALKITWVVPKSCTAAKAQAMMTAQPGFVRLPSTSPLTPLPKAQYPAHSRTHEPTYYSDIFLSSPTPVSTIGMPTACQYCKQEKQAGYNSSHQIPRPRKTSKCCILFLRGGGHPVT